MVSSCTPGHRGMAWLNDCHCDFGAVMSWVRLNSEAEKESAVSTPANSNCNGNDHAWIHVVGWQWEG